VFPENAQEGSIMSAIDPPQASTVVLPGAGFSMDAGLPLTRDLVCRGRERLKPEFRSEFVEALDALAADVLGEPIGEEVEPVLTRLRVLERTSFCSTP
jgi:hypothetical protein